MLPSLATALLLPLAQDSPEPQFRDLPGAFPGDAHWVEGIAVADVENDGDHDVLLARGEGWNAPGRPLPNGLFVNLLEEGALRLEDQSERRLGPYASHARDVVSGDLDGDSFADALFANGFNSAPPYLYVNRGAARPGYFRMESDERGFTEALSSASAALGDVDDDGDLDAVLLDAGRSYIGEPGGRPRLYLNDGGARFREAQDQLSAPLLVGLMGAHLADVDGDFDLDLFAPCREDRFARGHLLLLNDGAGSFHDSKAPLPKTTGSVYEAACGDLDGDADVDLFLVSLAETAGEGRFPFGEGPVLNRLAESGALAFEAGVAHGVDDDNDVVLLDFDQDGDLDAIVGSLGPGEKALENDGAGAFRLEPGVVEAIADRTLDLAAADLDRDGRVDLITAQGETGRGEEQPCRVFLNHGPRDERPPRILAVELPERLDPRGPFVLHVRAQDGVDDDGTSFVAGRATFLVDARPEAERTPPDAERLASLGTAARATNSGGGLWRFELDFSGAPPQAGSAIDYCIEIEDERGNHARSEVYRVAVEERPRGDGRARPPGGGD